MEDSTKDISDKKKNETHQLPVFMENENSSEDEEKVKSLIKVCERYGLQHLSGFISANYVNLDELYDDNLLDTEEVDTELGRFQLSGDWDPDMIPSLQRSLSLPSSLFPIEPVIQIEGSIDQDYDDFQEEEDTSDTSICRCGDYLSKIPSRDCWLDSLPLLDYVTVSQADQNNSQANNNQRSVPSSRSNSPEYIIPNETRMSRPFQKTILSKSQEELVDLMEAYKKGEKTMSEVEEQFNRWYRRHKPSPSDREKEKLQLKEYYLSMRKQGSRIRAFLGKPILRRKHNKVVRGNNSNKRIRSSPPLSPWPPLILSTIMRSVFNDYKSQDRNVLDGEKTPTPQPPMKWKPSPPPKLPNVLTKLKCDYPENMAEQEVDNVDNGPDSPGYITANTPIWRVPSRKKYRLYPACPLHCPIHSTRPCTTPATYKSSSCPSTIMRSKDASKEHTKRGNWTQLKDAFQNQLAGIAPQFGRQKQAPQAKFYVTRKWSSSPKLTSIEPHIYLELIDVYESRVRSISDSTPPVDWSRTSRV